MVFFLSFSTCYTGIQIAIYLTGVLGESLFLCGHAAGEDNTSAFGNHFTMRFNISSRLMPMESLHDHSLRIFPSLCLRAITECHPADPGSSPSDGSE